MSFLCSGGDIAATIADGAISVQAVAVALHFLEFGTAFRGLGGAPISMGVARESRGDVQEDADSAEGGGEAFEFDACLRPSGKAWRVVGVCAGVSPHF